VTASISETPIDLFHCGDERRVGCFVLETVDGLALFDCGPATCLPRLRAGLGERGLELGEIRHLLLSHIHLDHAGAAGAIVAAHPHIKVHVSAIGAPHLIDPTRLEASARRLWGDAFDALWGPLSPIPQARVHIVGGLSVGLETFPTPGHAAHHVSYLHEDGTLYCGDAAGVRITPGRFVFPPTPPPEVDLEAWETTITELERRRPRRLGLIHFGMFDDPERHLASFRQTLHVWADRVAHGMDVATFVATASHDVAASDPLEAEAYDRSAPYEHCFAGLERYWRKRREAAGA
jgi:glyoxylase-like metal-dependent hydrolase (beta-lactamase superfamily II)